MKIWAWRSITLRRPREDEGSGVLDVLGDEIEPEFCFHSSPNTVSQHYRTEWKNGVAKGNGDHGEPRGNMKEGTSRKGARQGPAGHAAKPVSY